MNRPGSTTDIPSHPIGILEDSSGIQKRGAEKGYRIQRAIPKTKVKRKQDADVNIDKTRIVSQAPGPLASREQVVEFGGPANFQGPREYREWDSEATMPPKKRVKYTHSNSPSQDIQSQVSSFPKGKDSGYPIGSPMMRLKENIPTHNHIAPERPPAYSPNIGTLTPAQMSNSKPGDKSSLPLSAANLSPSDPLNRESIGNAASKYYSSERNQERPQPYAPANFLNYATFKYGPKN